MQKLWYIKHISESIAGLVVISSGRPESPVQLAFPQVLVTLEALLESLKSSKADAL